jgi:uncharacterized membrane protein YdcZ (DUF606 family)
MIMVLGLGAAAMAAIDFEVDEPELAFWLTSAVGITVLIPIVIVLGYEVFKASRAK